MPCKGQHNCHCDSNKVKMVNFGSYYNTQESNSHKQQMSWQQRERKLSYSIFKNYVISPLYCGLSDHNAQLIKFNNIDIKIQNSKFKIIRRTDTHSILYFWYKMSFATWNSIFDSNDVNSMFN
jgi:hypothetical protein